MLPDIRLKHMHHDVPVIHQNPLGVREAFDAEGVDALGGQDAVHVVGNRPALAFGIPGADDEEISDGG